MHLPDRVRVFSGRDNRVNSVIVLGHEGVAVVDTQVTLEDGQELANAARSISNGRPIACVAITHEHFDHIAGNQFFQCNIVSSDLARQAIISLNLSGRNLPPSFKLTPPNVVFDKQCRLFLGGVTLVMELQGGHCPGESSIFIPEISALITGDLVFNNPLPPYIGSADLNQWTEALTRLYGLNPETVIPGHGEPGGKEILLRQRAWLENFVDYVNECISRKLSVEETCQAVFAKFQIPPERQRSMAPAVERMYRQARVLP